MEQELAYSFHLCSDKNKINWQKKFLKEMYLVLLLKYQREEKDNKISKLEGEISSKDKHIGKLQAEKERIKNELQNSKTFGVS